MFTTSYYFCYMHAGLGPRRVVRYSILLPSVSEVIVSVRLGSPIEQPTHIIAVAANIVQFRSLFGFFERKSFVERIDQH